jgi:O-antigen/teichoic acid export membrane protein
MTDVRQAIVYSSATRYVMRLIGLISTMVVARLLTPDEIGTFAIASAIVMVISEFRLLGAGAYLVREAELNIQKLRAALGLTILISWGMGGALVIASPWVADFYELAPITTLFRILAVSFFLAPYISIPTAMLTRTFQFRSLFVIRLMASLSGLASTVTLIHLGYSYYALAWGYTINVVVEFLAIQLLRPKGVPWLPSWAGMKPIAGLGIYSSIAGILSKTVVTAPDMIIGKMGTPAQVGLFSRGLGLIEFLSQTLFMGIGPVAMPYLAETKRTGGDLRWAYIRASSLLGGMLWPVLAVASVASLPIIRLFFGDQWDAAAPLASALAMWAMLRSVHWFANDLLITAHHERWMVCKEMILVSTLVFSIISAVPSGLEKIAMAFVFVGILECVLVSFLLYFKVNLSITRLAVAWIPNVAVALLCYGTTWCIGQFISFESPEYWKPVLAIAAILPPVWLISLKVCGHPLYLEMAKLVESGFSRLRLRLR